MKNAKVKKHPLASNEASDGKRPPRHAAAAGSLFLPAPATRLSLLGSLGGLVSGASKPHTGSSDGNTAIEPLCEVVTWLGLAWFGWQRGMKNWVCDSLESV